MSSSSFRAWRTLYSRQTTHRLSPFRQFHVGKPVLDSTAKQSSEKALESAQKALGTAQQSATKVFETAKKVGGTLGGGLAGLLGSYRQPLLYNLSVTREILKQIYIAERLQPPTSMSQVTTAYSTLFHRAKNPQYWRELFSSGEWARVGIYAIEAYAIFHIGEMVGRRSVIGYKLD